MPARSPPAVALMCVALFVAPVRALSSSISTRLGVGIFTEEASGAAGKLGVVPLGLEDALMPGETRDLFFFEERFRRCLSDAKTSNGGYLAALYLTDTGEVCDLSSLLEIQAWKADSCHVWCSVRCVGRCRIVKMLRRKGEHPFHVAQIEPLVDVQGNAAAAPVDELLRVHNEGAAKRRELLEVLSSDLLESEKDDADSEYIFVAADKAASPFGVFVGAEGFFFDEDDEEFSLEEYADDEAEYVFIGQPWERPSSYGTSFFHCRDRGELDDEESGKNLDELLAARQHVLLQGGRNPDAAGSEGGEASASLFDAVGELWGVDDEEAAQRQMLSYAASAMLGPAERATALLICDTTERIVYALSELKKQDRHLSLILEDELSERSNW